MSYNVRIEYLAQDVPDVVKNSILDFLQNYTFPYVSSVQNKLALKDLFIDHFSNRKTLNSLVDEIKMIATQSRYATSVAWTETNRAHTAGLATVLKSIGQTQCTVIHTYGQTPMNSACATNLDGKVLDIDTIVNNSFPTLRQDILRNDIPMIPQHVNCRHVMSPLNGVQIQ